MAGARSKQTNRQEKFVLPSFLPLGGLSNNVRFTLKHTPSRTSAGRFAKSMIQGGGVGGVAWPYHKAKVQGGGHGTWAYKVALGQSDPLVVAGRILKTEITRDRSRH